MKVGQAGQLARSTEQNCLNRRTREDDGKERNEVPHGGCGKLLDQFQAYFLSSLQIHSHYNVKA